MRQKRKQVISLLNGESSYFELPFEDQADLNLESFLNTVKEKCKIDLAPYFGKLLTDVEHIVYRQEIMKDFVDYPNVFQALKIAIEQAAVIKNIQKFAFEKEVTLYNLQKRADEADQVMQLVLHTRELVRNTPFKSRGLKTLGSLLDETVLHPVFESMESDIRQIKSMPNGIMSITLGINLDAHLGPKEAILLSLNEEQVKYGRPLKKMGKIINHAVGELLLIPRRIFAGDSIPFPEALNSLEKLVSPAVKQLIDFCDQFIMRQLDILEPLKGELPFYEAGIFLFNDIKDKGLPLVLPTWVDKGETHVKDVYNLNLAYELNHQHMTLNDLNMTEDGAIMILTGANRGGKTTFTQAIGQLYWLGQLGFYVPARSASMKIVQGLYVHFPKEETKTVDLGRLGEECKRFATIFNQIDQLPSRKNALVVMNESFSGTSHLESLTIASEAVRGLKALGASVLFNTHLHELGAMTAAFNQEFPEGPIAKSLVTGTQEDYKSFKVHEGPPLGQSYAAEIAKKYGMAFEQLIESV